VPLPKKSSLKNRPKAPRLEVLEQGMIDAAHAAGKSLLSHFRGTLQIREKAGAGLVSNADLEAEAAALSVLRKLRPDFGELTEETAPEGPVFRKGSSSREGLWIVDPLDGTTNFIHGFPMFCVSIAAEWKGELVAGVIHHPVLNETWTATRGGGARLNGKAIQVSKTRQLSDSLLTTGFSYRKDQYLRDEMSPFEKISAVARAVRRPGSAALDLAYTASGVFDGFWERKLAPWDVAAGALLVLEAGGCVTHFSGEPWQLHGREIVATNKRLHPDLIDILSERELKNRTPPR
jgi:myo-inositol-1(or 4)-monophosphatase